MEWERAAWVGVLALASAGVAGGVAAAASKQAPPATGPSNGRGGPRLPLPPTVEPVPVSVTPRLPPTVTTTTTTTAPVINYQNVVLQAGVNGAVWLHDVNMVNPTSLTIQLPAGGTWALSNPLAKASSAYGTLPKSVSNVVAHTSGNAPSVLTFNGTVGNLDDVITLRWLDASGAEQESQLTLIAVAPPLQSPAPVGTIRTIPPVPQTTVTLQPGAGGLTGSAPWQTQVNVKNGSQVVIQLPSGGKWNGNGNPLQGGAVGLDLTPVYPGGSVTNVSGAQLSGNTPVSFLFSGVIGKISYVLTLNWTDANLRSQQAQLSLMATA